ncbi:MAG: DNA-3-methyladenine glycosylase 2 family protein [Firmicutes bacterium]|nr:DNA-3-methyladenine glycosylase 2 family protein [Bacillota bacterium]
MQYFPYGETEITYLQSQDPKLGKEIERLGMIKRQVIPDPFESLINSIISQQISKKAAATVSGRVYDLLDGCVAPESIISVGPAAIKGCGMSERKAGYIMGIAEAALSGEVDFDTLHTLSDQEIIKKLITLRGVGVWTAEMLLIFSLARPDVVSYGDLAIRRGMMTLYGLDELSRKQFATYAKRYSPYGSVASLYLWALAGQ